MPVELQILYPVFALILLNFLVLGVMSARRFKAIRSKKVDVRYFKTYKNEYEVPVDVQTASRHYINLFELPILFYALIPFILLYGKQDSITVILSWIFVAARYMHAGIHMFGNKLMWRGGIFGIGVFTLLILWVRFFLQMLNY